MAETGQTGRQTAKKVAQSKMKVGHSLGSCEVDSYTEKRIYIYTYIKGKKKELKVFQTR